MAAMFGGVVGQEVMKAASGKFHPLFQFFYFDSIESLPQQDLQPDDVAPQVGCTADPRQTQHVVHCKSIGGCCLSVTLVVLVVFQTHLK